MGVSLSKDTSSSSKWEKHKQQHSLKLYVAKIRLATEFRAWLTTQIQSESIATYFGN